MTIAHIVVATSLLNIWIASYILYLFALNEEVGHIPLLTRLVAVSWWIGNIISAAFLWRYA